MCASDWGGTDCATPFCRNQCSAHGVCMADAASLDAPSRCHCARGWIGRDCSRYGCTPRRRKRALAQAAAAAAAAPAKRLPALHSESHPVVGALVAYGSALPAVVHVGCGANGACVAGVCHCASGWTNSSAGGFCDKKECGPGCNARHQQCVDGQCLCQEGWGGEHCVSQTCAGGCGSEKRGACVAGACVCKNGWIGARCGRQSCSGRGQWIVPHADESKGKASASTSGGGGVRPHCVCTPPYRGEFCRWTGCPHNCRERGVCDRGRCYCRAPFTGASCGGTTSEVVASTLRNEAAAAAAAAAAPRHVQLRLRLERASRRGDLRIVARPSLRRDFDKFLRNASVWRALAAGAGGSSSSSAATQLDELVAIGKQPDAPSGLFAFLFNDGHRKGRALALHAAPRVGAVGTFESGRVHEEPIAVTLFTKANISVGKDEPPLLLLTLKVPLAFDHRGGCCCCSHF